MLAADRIGALPPTKPGKALPPNALLLNCFGRGGSSIVWNIIGSSPDVLMPNREWHQGVFGRFYKLRKAACYVGGAVNWASVPFLWRHMRAATAETVLPGERNEKSQARYVVLKVMDYYIAFDDAIARGFTETRNLVLTRHPLPMCEGLMRSGLSEARAIKWYNDVTSLMFEASGKSDALLLRFEDLVRSPDAFVKSLYDALGIAAAEDGRIWFKVKSFGTERMTNTNAASGEKLRIRLDEAPDHIAPDVNTRAVARLDHSVRQRIWTGTRATAELFDYGDDNF
jgi:Sulfotransferase family